MKIRSAILVSTPLKPGLAAAIADGAAPRRDYLELCYMLGAELLCPPSVPGAFYAALQRVGGHSLAMAVSAWLRRTDYDLILTDQEGVGLLLALLFKLTRTRRGHLMISHYLTPPKKQLFFRRLHVQTHIDRVICYSSPQERLARQELGLAPAQVSLVLHPADGDFWRPARSEDEERADAELLRGVGIELDPATPLVCGAGLEFRDYPTLVGAMNHLHSETQLIIAAASPWSKRKDTSAEVELPPNVRRVSLKPPELRALYRRAAVVAIPLYDVDFQAGSLVAYEAMACGKPVVITRTRGQVDIVRQDSTGLYVAPGDAVAFAAALARLLDDEALARQMGRAARATVERGLNLDTYLRHIADLMAQLATRQPWLGALPRAFARGR